MLTCRDCVHYDVCYKIEHFGRDLETDEICKEFYSNGQWIDIKDRLPNCEDVFLVCRDDGKYQDIDLGLWNIFKQRFEYFDCEFCGIKVPDVTHWMPLPELPEKECNEM